VRPTFTVLVSLLGLALLIGAAATAGYGTIYVDHTNQPNPAAFGVGGGLAVAAGLCFVAAAIALPKDRRDSQLDDR
jgi:drug/metabolite transporter (DMT)-like permease